MTSPLISSTELLKLNNVSFVLIDARSGSEPKKDYVKNHLKGAVFVDLNTQLADIKNDFALGGRHPLPTAKDFAKLIGELGIGQETHVVVYDNHSGANAAARFWWMLKSLGHQTVQVLDGGFQAAEKANYPMESGEVPYSKKSPYPAENWVLPIANINEVEQAALSKEQVLIDVRAANRYAGEVEPIDFIAGHIPGAINVPFTENLNESGLFLTAEELKAKYEKIFGSIALENGIVHCGSGVTACHTLLAMDYAGLALPKLYVGSWSEWSRNQKPMITKSN